jgi:hypothetical protein
VQMLSWGGWPTSVVSITVLFLCAVRSKIEKHHRRVCLYWKNLRSAYFLRYISHGSWNADIISKTDELPRNCFDCLS